MNKNGFTLIELVLVLVIIGIGSAVVVAVLYRSMDDIYLKTAAKEISTSLRYARSHAVAEKKIYSFVMNKNGYGLYSESNADLKIKEETLSSVFHKTFPKGVSAEYNDGEDVRIDFYPHGDSTGGEIKLKNEEGSTAVITVEKVSGKVRVEKAQNSK
ncbi:MAG: GspH/FimT family pseudopilin [Nitrospirae bacterium]|nr:GspH/FimT family pseudopilin [Nitrospirota bacterium]